MPSLPQQRHKNTDLRLRLQYDYEREHYDPNNPPQRDPGYRPVYQATDHNIYLVYQTVQYYTCSDKVS